MNNRSVSNCSILSRAASRMLAALAEPGTSAVADPTRDGMMILRGTRGAVSVGRGAYPESACRELAAHDLVLTTEGGHATIVSDAGRMHVRRAGASGPDERFRDQHADIETATVVAETGRAEVAINTGESPLDWLRRRKDRDGSPLIDPISYEAGERLRRDLTLAGMMPSVTARWDGAIGSGGGALRDPSAATDATIAARQRVRNALSEVGQDFADLLIDLCGFLKGLETIERERHWPQRSAKVVVRLALRRLAEHYGLETEARGPARSRGVRTWWAEECA